MAGLEPMRSAKVDGQYRAARTPSRALAAQRALSDTRWPLWIARAHAVLLSGYLFITFIGTQSFTYTSIAERVEGSPVDRVIVLTLFALSLPVIWEYRRQALATLRANVLLYGVIAFCVLSVLWSAYPGLTLRRAGLLVNLMAIATAIAAGVTDLRRFHTTLFTAQVGIVVLNFAATAIWPAQAISDLGVQGLFVQKNVAGEFAMITLVTGVMWIAGAPRGTPLLPAIGGVMLTLLFLILTRSKTSLALTVDALAIAAVFATARQVGARFLLLVVASAALVFVAMLIAVDFDIVQLLGVFFADPSFTGRNSIWAFALTAAREATWLGHGYGAFWDVGLENDPLQRLQPGTWLGDVEKGLINQAHNGYLELWLHIGLPATIVAVISVIACIVTTTRRAMAHSPDRGERLALAALALILLLYLMHNLTEATLFMRGSQFCNLALLVQLVASKRIVAARPRVPA